MLAKFENPSFESIINELSFLCCHRDARPFRRTAGLHSRRVLVVKVCSTVRTEISASMARSWLSLLLAGALGALLGCGLTARLMTAPQVSSLVEGHSSAAMEGGARFTTLSIEHGTHAEKGAEPGEEEEEGVQEEEQEEEQEGEEFGGIFAMEEVDPLVISTLLIGLIVVTIGYEQRSTCCRSTRPLTRASASFSSARWCAS